MFWQASHLACFLMGGRESRRTQGCCQIPHSQRQAISRNRTKDEIVSGGTLQAGFGMEGARHVGVRGAWDANLARTNGQVRGAIIDCHMRGIEVGGIGCGWVSMVDKLTRDVVGESTRVDELMVGRVDGLMADGVGERRGWQVEGDKVDKLTKDEVPVLIVDRRRS